MFSVCLLSYYFIITKVKALQLCIKSPYKWFIEDLSLGFKVTDAELVEVLEDAGLPDEENDFINNAERLQFDQVCPEESTPDNCEELYKRLKRVLP